MRNFKIEDFDGAGQYLVRMCPNQMLEQEKNKKPYVKDAGFLSTLMYKAGWLTNNYNIGNGENLVCLIAMSDGMTLISNYTNKKLSKKSDYNKVIWQNDSFEDRNGIQKFCDWLNNSKLSNEYRFATQEEVVRVVLYQQTRCKG